jgi:hypothetical protein
LGGEVIFNDEMPYTDEMLATIFHRKVNTVRLALETFQKLRMIEIAKDRTIIICNWGKHQSMDGLEKIRQQNLERKRRHREKQLEERNKRLLSHNGADVRAALQLPALSRDSHVTRHVTKRDAVTQNSVTVTHLEEEKENKSTEVPPAVPLSRGTKPSKSFRSDSEETLIRKLQSEGKNPADYVTNCDEAKRLICQLILNGKDPSRPWSYQTMQDLARQLPIPRIEIERVSWFRGLPNDGTPELEARKKVTESGLMAFWSDEVTRATTFWNEIYGWRDRVASEKKEPPLWREFLRAKYGENVRLPKSFDDLDRGLMQQYHEGIEEFRKQREAA